MKIALLSPSIYMSPTKFGDMIFAPRDLAIALADGLVDRGHEVSFFTAPDIQTKAHLVPGDAQLLENDYVTAMLKGRESERLRWGYFYSLKYNYEMDLTQKCYHAAKSEGFDIIHSYHERAAHFFEAMSGFPTVYTLHDPLPEDKLDLKYWLLDTYREHRYVSISNAFRRHPSLHLNYIDTVYHGIDVDQIVPSFEPGSYVAFMARLIAEKGADQAITVAKQLHLPLKIATSTVAENSNDDTYYKERIEPILDPQTMTFTGFLDAKGKADYLAHAKCLLFPIGWEEPFGMVMIESMVCGTPVVAYNRGSVSEIVKDGVTGFIIDPDDEDRPGKGGWVIKKQGIEGLVEAVQRIGEIDRAACRRHVEEHFTPQQTTQGYERVYQKVVSQES